MFGGLKISFLSPRGFKLWISIMCIDNIVYVNLHDCYVYRQNACHPYIYIYIWLIAKRCTNGGSDFWLSVKSVSNTLSSCCSVCAFIIGQYHSGNNMSSKSGAAGEILISESEKRHRIRPLKTDLLTVSAFDTFIHVHDESKHYLSHWFAQRRHYTVHIKSVITKFCFWS